ncbi:cytochrome c oxidase assembly protein COX16 homolog, mitochondrial-like [Liolophura sinensis]|uniref:cytochrome c oxidase assembly protein COX16 homolog, mitochondrial-like n=1 Tax=Liolophura sinensis TaxID=3198878 RepID=UPI0031593BD3
MTLPIVNWWRRARKRKFIRFGAPFLVLVVAGSFGLKEFSSIRYQFRKSEMITPEEAEKYGVKMKREKITIESEYESLQKMNLDTWQNVRGPRPWEDSKKIQDEQRQVSSKQS